MTGGAWDVPPDWLCVVCLLVGIVAVAVSLLSFGVERPIERLLPLYLFAACGAFCIGLGAWMSWLRRGLLRSVSLDDLAEQEHVDSALLRRALAQQGVEPAIVSNGHAYYDPAEIGDIALLLRPAGPPDEATLLRPADTTQMLVRPAAHPEAAGPQ